MSNYTVESEQKQGYIVSNTAQGKFADLCFALSVNVEQDLGIE